MHRWPQPQPLDKTIVHEATLQQLAEQVTPDCSDTMERLTREADTNGTFAHWSEVAENALLAASRDAEGEVLRAASFRGRGQHTKPVSARLAAPRYKQRRSGDFAVGCPSVALIIGRLPPFWYEGKWVMLDDDPAFFFVLPSVVTSHMETGGWFLLQGFDSHAVGYGSPYLFCFNAGGAVCLPGVYGPF